MAEFKNISPDELTKMVSFYRDPEGFTKEYAEYNMDSMQAKQAEGSSYLFNLLNEKGIALLADEVGMGKTIQSLAVCAALWQQKPDAQILVLAPRNEIAYNWQNEYETFINVHYKLKDNIVKSSIGGHPINPSIFCSNLYDLVGKVNKQWGRLFIGKISSFSGLMSKDDLNSRLDEVGISTDEEFDPENSIETVRRIAELMRTQLKGKLKSGRFDLIIIDEAHYFRNKNGHSLRVNVAEELFGMGENRLAERVLLLTATPNHSSSDNIKAIVSYFDARYNDSTFSEILDDICLRRFRRLSRKGKIKYNYRKELPRQADFKNEMAELFFGVYQKQIVKDYVEGKANGSRRNILGFLEGTEFIPHQRQTAEPEEVGDLRDGQDFKSGTDGEILLNLSAKYKEIFGTFPSHPKYDLLVKDLIQPEEDLANLNDKKLVFVRRIPSVREIAGRVNLQYDQILLKKISKALGRELSLNAIDIRAYYQSQVESILSDEEEDEEIEIDEQEADDSDAIQSVPISKVMYLFKTLKKSDNSIRSTHASNFRLRFTRSRPSIFNVFFAPPADYIAEEYSVRLRRSHLKSKGWIDDHYLSCLLHRADRANSQGTTIQIHSLLGGRENDEVVYKDEIHYRIPTLFTIYWDYLREQSDPELEVLKALYAEFSIFEKEAFSGFIEKGILLASPGLVDLYVSFIEVSINSDLKSYDLYIAFVDKVKESLNTSCIPEIMSASLKNFRVLCEKVFSVTKNEDLLKEEWKNFYDAQPAYAYSGDTKNQRVMTSFNTPFFPDVLISTSVLQEGVNLQYFCDKIIHYGIAWTPGDNEQRVGRIDRMFSKTERELELDENSTLRIYYPYLRNTIDQDHLANFISKKYFAENLIDKCQAYYGKTNLDPENFNYENWQEYFREPEEVKAADPYDVKAEELNPSTYSVNVSMREDVILKRIIKTFQDENIPTYDPMGNSSLICVLDPTLESKRKQPVFVEMHYEPKATGLLSVVAHRLTMRTPLGRKKQVNKFEELYSEFKQFDQESALTCKMCYDKDQPVNSIWGVYMKVELPVFINHKDDPLSSHELLTNYRLLIEYADRVEQLVTGADLSLETEGTKVNDFSGESNVSGLRKKLASEELRVNWKKVDEFIYLSSQELTSYSVKEEWSFNHIIPFKKHFQNKVIIPFHAHDIQDIEYDFLEHLL